MNTCDMCGAETMYVTCPTCRDQVDGALVRIPGLEAMLREAQVANASLRQLLPGVVGGSGERLTTCTECAIVGGEDPDWCEVCSRGRHPDAYVQALEDATQEANIERDRLTVEAARRVSKHLAKVETH